MRPALQRCRASVATGGANKTLWPASLEQKRRAARLVGKPRLEFAQRSCPCHWAPPRACRVWLAASLLYIIWSSLGQRDKPPRKHWLSSKQRAKKLPGSMTQILSITYTNPCCRALKGRDESGRSENISSLHYHGMPIRELAWIDLCPMVRGGAGRGRQHHPDCELFANRQVQLST